jgi:hypothetical protein
MRVNLIVVLRAHDRTWNNAPRICVIITFQQAEMAVLRQMLADILLPIARLPALPAPALPVPSAAKSNFVVARLDGAETGPQKCGHLANVG